MKTITPTLAICATALVGATALLALPANTPSSGVSTPVGDPTAPTASGELVIESFAFVSPTVEAGAVVAIVNRDEVEHTVTANDAAFDTTIGPGVTVTFDAPSTPGTYAFVCVIHPSMAGSIAVT